LIICGLFSLGCFDVEGTLNYRLVSSFVAIAGSVIAQAFAISTASTASAKG